MKTFISTFVVSLMILSLIPYISADASVWMHIAFDQAVRKVQIHPKDPSYIYVTVDGQGTLKTTDGGNNWQKLIFKKPDKLRSPVVIALHPTDTRILYGTAVVSPIGGLLPIKSGNGGESWEEIWQGLGLDDLWDRAYFRAITVDPNEPETIYLGDASGPPVCGTYVSRDGGRSWKLVVDNWQGNGASFFAISPLDSTVYAIIPTNPGGFIIKSSDRVSSWKTIFGNIEGIVSAIAIDPTTDYLYVHGSELPKDEGIPRWPHTGMYKSMNKGESWQSIDNGFPFVFDGLAGYSYAISALAVDANHPNTIYAATLAGVYRSQDAGESWHPFNEGLTSLNVHWIAVNPIDSSVYAGTNHGLFKADIENETFVNPQGKMPTTWGRIKEEGQNKR